MKPTQKCTDPIFGEMIYNHRWVKQGTIVLFNKQWAINIAAKAYLGKAITGEQRTCYKEFIENEQVYLKQIENELKKYINNNLKILAENWAAAKEINATEEMANIVTPKTLLFEQDGSSLLLLDCVWDMEDGIAVKLSPDVFVAPQSNLL